MAEQRRTTDLVGDVRVKGGTTAPRDKDKDKDKKDIQTPEIPGVRSSDLEPYSGLRYVSKLFRLIAVVLLLLLIAEIITGVTTQGSASIPDAPGRSQPPHRAGGRALGRRRSRGAHGGHRP